VKGLNLLAKMVGGTGIEPVTPTMSMFAAPDNPLKDMEQSASKLADSSPSVAMNTGQSRAKRGRAARFLLVERSRHGKTVYYARKGQGPRVRLPDDYGSKAFWKAYDEAEAAIERGLHARPGQQHRGRVGMAMAKSVSAAKQRARERSLPFDLTYEWAIAQVERQNFKCALTDIPFFSKWGDRTAQRDPMTPSIDRIFPERGYVQSNCRVVSLGINTMMLDWGEDFFRRMASSYLKHRKAQKEAV
jgi:hypothetical protein